MKREVHVRFWEGAGLQCPALLAYLKSYSNSAEAHAGIAMWVAFYNGRRPHQALGGRMPMAVWRAGVSGVIEGNAVDLTLRLDNAGALPTTPQRHSQEQTRLIA